MAKDLPNPVSMSFQQWGNLLSLTIPQYKVPIAINEENWIFWAKIFLIDNRLDGVVQVPNKYTYPNKEDWRKWATLLYMSLPVE